MKLTQFFSRFTATATLAAMTLFSPLSFTAELPAADQYVRLGQALPADQAEQTEVIEFFAYSCPYCAMFAPYVQQWAANLPEQVAVKRVPVAFNAGMGDLQRMYYTLEALDRLDLHDALFAAIHQQKENLFDKKALARWASEQGIDADTFDQAFNSFGVQTRANQAKELAKQYQIDGTPTLAIGGQYLTSPALAGGYEQAIDIAQQLLDYRLQSN